MLLNSEIAFFTKKDTVHTIHFINYRGMQSGRRILQEVGGREVTEFVQCESNIHSCLVRVKEASQHGSGAQRGQ